MFSETFEEYFLNFFEIFQLLWVVWKIEVSSKTEVKVISCLREQPFHF